MALVSDTKKSRRLPGFDTVTVRASRWNHWSGGAGVRSHRLWMLRVPGMPVSWRVPGEAVLALATGHMMRRTADRAGLHLSIRELIEYLEGIGETVLHLPRR